MEPLFIVPRVLSSAGNAGIKSMRCLLMILLNHEHVSCLSAAKPTAVVKQRVGASNDGAAGGCDLRVDQRIQADAALLASGKHACLASARFICLDGVRHRALSGLHPKRV